MKNSYNDLSLKKDVIMYGFTDGAFRGILQIPVVLGIGMALIRSGSNGPDALADIFLYVIGLPRFFSWLTQIAGGILSTKLGRIGSFITLIPGFFLRAVAILLYLTSCLSDDRQMILICGFFATVVSEIGRGIISGSVQDAYEQMAHKVSDSAESLIAVLNNEYKLFQFLARIIVTITGTSLIITGPIFNHRTAQTVIAFLIAVIPQLYSCFNSIMFYDLAKTKIGNSKKIIDIGDVKGQFKVFFKNGDWMWSAGYSLLIYNIMYTVIYSPFTSSSILDDINNASVSLSAILLLIAMSINPPFSSLFSLKTFNAFYDVKTINERLYSNKGISLFALSAISVCLFSSFKPYSPVTTVILIFIVNCIWTPLLVWGEWVRRKIIECIKIQPEHSKHLGSTNVFYYSMIDGANEFVIAVASSLFYAVKEFHLEKSYTIFLGITAIFLITSWFNTRANKPLTILTGGLMKTSDQS